MNLEAKIESAIRTWVNDVLIKGILATAHADRFRILKGVNSLTAPPIKDRLTVRTGRLLGALSPKGNEYSIRNITREGWKFRLEWGIKETLLYAEIHEKGGVIRVTPRSRRFFWFKYKTTGEPKWRYLAISKKTAFVMPPRPYFYVAIENAKEQIEESAQNFFDKLIQNLIKELES